mmetsp:Transcript_4442/g.6557  ORF Transcript_4442/g.6557 Transcript_4442/m.6557 type:complete len:331 (-) Transcript_4442:54-1046(-)
MAESNYERGKDVVINWEFLDGFNSDGDLWIDTNGLDMHQKKLWARREFAYNKTENIASNFYPVQSAIAIRDKNSNKQVTIMTDRTQSGSAGLRQNRNIELMQNRRINGWDAYGITEKLDDLDHEGRGLQIKASYYMQIFKKDHMQDGVSPSKQREQQRIMEQPILIQYSKDFKISQNSKFQLQVPTSGEAKNASAGLGQTHIKAKDSNEVVKKAKTVKTLVYAAGNNSVLVRVSNMEDSFDKEPRTFHFDVQAFARELFLEANPSLSEEQLLKMKIKVDEKTLTGVSGYSKRQDESEIWKINEPASLAQSLKQRPSDKVSEEAFIATLEP